MADITMMRRKKQPQWCQKKKEEETEDDETKARTATTKSSTSTNATLIELKRVEKELRITKILKDDLETKLEKTRDELLKAQTQLYTTSQKRTMILNYIDWLDEYYNYENDVSGIRRRVVSTKFLRDNL